MVKSFSETVTVLRALGDENRMRIVIALRRQPLCVCQIVELVQLATSTVSEHLMILKAAGILASRKEGRWVYYRFADKHATSVVAKNQNSYPSVELGEPTARHRSLLTWPE
jgi:ArsR family transcriptional regulator